MFSQHGNGFRRQGDIATPAFRLGRLHPQSGSRLFEASLDAKHRAIKINVAPLQREQFAASHAGRQCKARNWTQAVAAKRVKDGLNLIGR
jgi:hypothetical protein